ADLPLRRDGGSASFGLDLGAELDRIAGPQAPGTFLVGVRRLGEGSARRWMRLTATDLALTTLEEPEATRVVVTSLATATPVAGAEVTVEGVHYGIPGGPRWEELFRGRTDARGFVAWEAPGSPEQGWIQVERIAVAAGNDRLVLDPDRAPDAFADNRWN